jgi:hypothetical protein
MPYTTHVHIALRTTEARPYVLNILVSNRLDSRFIRVGMAQKKPAR